MKDIKDIKEIPYLDLLRLKGDTITISCFSDHLFLVIALLKALGVKEYSIAHGRQSNSGIINHQQPIVAFNGKSDEFRELNLSLGMNGQQMILKL